MKVYNLNTATAERHKQRKSWLYNTLDVISTRRIHDTLKETISPEDYRTYRFQMASQAPAFAMATRGVLVDPIARDKAITELDKELRKLEREFGKHPQIAPVWDQLEKVTGECKTPSRKDGKHKWAKGVEDTPERRCDDCGISRFRVAAFNPASPDQVKHLLYDLHKAKVCRNKDGEVSVDDECLDRIKASTPRISGLVEAIQSHRGLKKQRGFLKAKLSPEGRWHSSFNVGAAWTGRWSSNKSPEGYGGNAQNIAERFRHMFIADPGYELVNFDLKTAESNVVAHLAGDEEYIHAHASGDVHTYVTRLVWPELPWTWDIKKDKKIASDTNPEWDQAPGHNLRFQSKRVQHGSNYLLTPFGMAIIAHIPVAAAQDSQGRYFRAFPKIRPNFHGTIRRKVQQQERLVNPLGIGATLYGRPWDERTAKQGASYLPQGLVAHIINIGALRIWHTYRKEGVQLLKQVHDALLMQIPVGRRDLIPLLAKAMSVPVPITDPDGVTRVLTIDVEGAVGLNWGKHHPEKNPRGLEEISVKG